MNSITYFLRKLAMLFRRNRFREELDEEMSFHREQVEQDLQNEGERPDTARAAARRQFGNDTLLKEKSHEVIAFRAESIAQDLRFAIRQLGRNSAFTVTAILTLALGMSASVAIFAFVDAALIKPLPYPNPTRLVSLHESGAMFPRAPLSYADYLDWKRLNTVFSSMDVYTGTSSLLATPAGTEAVPAVTVSAGFFRTLGITPVLGRDFYQAEDAPQAPNTVLLSYGAWQRRFGGRKNVIGQAVRLDGVAATIIGVLPKDFQFAPRGAAEFWAALRPNNWCLEHRSCHNVDGIARLKESVSVQAASADMNSIARQLEMQYPDSNRGQSASVVLLSQAIVGDVRPILLVLLVGAALLELIACVNVSSLLLVRSERRRREIAVRGALGASRARLMGQFVTEGLVLVTAASLLGLGLADGGMQILLRLISKDMMATMPYLQGLGLSLHVIIFAAILAVLAAVLFSITPMLRLPLLSEMRNDLSEGGRGSAGTLWRRLGANLVAVELATAVVLLFGAGLLGKSLYRLLHVDLGFRADHLAMMEVALPENALATDGQIILFARQVLNRIVALPGVESAATTSDFPVSCNCDTDSVRIVGRPYNGTHYEVISRNVSANFFTTLRTRVLEGRYFSDSDDKSKPKVVVINQAFAREYFPGQDPIGKRIGDPQLSPDSLREIIGVVEDIKESALDEELWPTIYAPFNQNPEADFGLVVRTAQDNPSILPTLVAAIQKLNPNAGVQGVMTMGQRIDDSQPAYLHRSSAWLVGGFAALALLLSAVGLYGVVAYSVSQRTREIGVRMALGAQRGAVYRLILKDAGWFTGVGIPAGLLCSVACATLMRKLLFGTEPWDPWTLAAVAMTLAIASLIASFVPARRAASVNPVEALRAE